MVFDKETLMYGAAAALSLFALNRLIRWLRIRIMKGVYFHGKTVLVTGASGGLGKGIFDNFTIIETGC